MPTHPASIFTDYTFPNGQRIKNRIVKSAMEESMASNDFTPSKEMIHLYDVWAQGGTGLLLTGNVMVDKLAMTGPAGVALEHDTVLTEFKELAAVVHKHQSKIWMQINHPGRQVYKNMDGKVYSPSDIPLDLGKHSDMFGQPKAMTEPQIQDVIERFVVTAVQAEKAGFDGVQIHAAHGYLLAQFLSPRVNKRDDKWGGSLENRARLLLDIIQAIKAKTGDDFAVAVKLNSADFQKGGFSFDDACQVVNMLERFNLDLIELSGGSYEVPAMQGVTADGTTLEREAYFLKFAKKIAEHTSIPIMTTGGIRRLAVAQSVLGSGVDLVGIATGLAIEPSLPSIWMNQPEFEASYPDINWNNKTLRGLAVMAVVRRQMHRIGSGKDHTKTLSPAYTLIRDFYRAAKSTKQYKLKLSAMIK